MKVLFTTCFLSPYRMDFFNELGKLCDVIVLAEENSGRQTHRNEKWFSKSATNFEVINLELPRKRKRARGKFIWAYVKKYRPDIVVIGGYSTNTEIINLLTSRLHKEKIVLNFDGIAVDNIYIKSWKDFIKKFLIRSANKYLISGETTYKFLEKFGVNRRNAYIYPFTSLYKSEIMDNVLSKDEKEILRKTLNITEEKIIISVGRFIESKGFDTLLKAAQLMNGNIGIYIVGDQPSEKYIEMAEKVKGVKVHFIEFQCKEMLMNYYRASDLFVLPTRSDVWGLVINEAMANGLPIITTDHCVAGLELVENGDNGYIVPINDSDILKDRIMDILNCEQKRILMAKNNLKKIRSYTIENMARINFEAFKKIMGEKCD